jgi:hypothetical protein
VITTTRTSLLVLAATAALGVAAPAASAKPLVTGVGQSPVALSPDRSDQIGTVDQVTGIHPLQVAATTTGGSTSFDWTAAAVGAGSVLSVGLVGAGAVGLRSRRRMALGV